MKKHAGLEKAHILWGAVEKKNDAELDKLALLFSRETERHRNNMLRINELKMSTSHKLVTRRHPSGRTMSERDFQSTQSQFDKLFERQQREQDRHLKKVGGFLDRKSFWLSHPGKYSFVLEKVSHSVAE